MKQWLIYKHTNMKSGKAYVGMTCRGIRTRWIRHLNESITGDTHFHRALKLYGPDVWEHEILVDSIDTEYEAFALEIYHIKLEDTFENGYNSTYGGPGTNGSTRTEAQIAAISARMTGNNYAELGKEKRLVTMELKREELPKYVFTHELHGTVTMSCVGLANKYELPDGSSSSLNQVAKGNKDQCYGWFYGNTARVTRHSIITLYHDEYGKAVGTAVDIAEQYGLLQATKLGRVYRGEAITAYGWRATEERYPKGVEKAVYKYNSDNELLAVYPSGYAADRELGLKEKRVSGRLAKVAKYVLEDNSYITYNGNVIARELEDKAMAYDAELEDKAMQYDADMNSKMMDAEIAQINKPQGGR